MEAIIQQAYQEIVGVQATPAQISYWSGQLNRRLITPEDLKYALAKSIISKPISTNTSSATVNLAQYGSGLNYEQIMSGKVQTERVEYTTTVTLPPEPVKVAIRNFVDVVHAQGQSSNWYARNISNRTLWDIPSLISSNYRYLAIGQRSFFVSNTLGLDYWNLARRAEFPANNWGASNPVDPATVTGYLMWVKYEPTDNLGNNPLLYAVATDFQTAYEFINTDKSYNFTNLPPIFNNVSPIPVKVSNVKVNTFFDSELEIFTNEEVVKYASARDATIYSFEVQVTKTETPVVIVDTVTIPPGDQEALIAALQSSSDAYRKARSYVLSYIASKTRQEESGLFFQHNWVSPLSERIEYKTDVITSRGGHEQRRILRQLPRTTFEYNFLLTNNELQLFKNFVYRHHSHKVTVPIHTRTQQILGKTAQGILVKFPLRSGDRVMVGFDELFPIICEVESVTEVNGKYEIVLKGILLNNISDGSTITPLRIGRIKDVSQISFLTGDVGQARVMAEVVDLAPNRTVSLQFLDSTETSVLRAPIFFIEPNFVTNPVSTVQRRTANIDYGNAYKMYDLEPFAEQKLQRQYMVNLAKDSVNIIDAFHFARGQARRFYIPTYLNDLVIHPLENITAGEYQMRLKSCGYKYTEGLFIHFLVVIFFHSRPPLIRTVDTIKNMLGYEQVVFSEGFEFNFTAKDVKMISKLDLCRFSSDTLEINWVTRELANVTAQVEVLNGG